MAAGEPLGGPPTFRNPHQPLFFLWTRRGGPFAGGGGVGTPGVGGRRPFCLLSRGGKTKKKGGGGRDCLFLPGGNPVSSRRGGKKTRSPLPRAPPGWGAPDRPHEKIFSPAGPLDWLVPGPPGRGIFSHIVGGGGGKLGGGGPCFSVSGEKKRDISIGGFCNGGIPGGRILPGWESLLGGRGGAHGGGLGNVVGHTPPPTAGMIDEPPIGIFFNF